MGLFLSETPPTSTLYSAVGRFVGRLRNKLLREVGKTTVPLVIFMSSAVPKMPSGPAASSVMEFEFTVAGLIGLLKLIAMEFTEPEMPLLGGWELRTWGGVMSGVSVTTYSSLQVVLPPVSDARARRVNEVVWADRVGVTN